MGEGQAGPIIALTGATGFVGRNFLDLARQYKVRIRALTRTARADEPNIQYVTGTLDDHAALAQLCAGADSALHLAGAVNAPDRAGFAAANITGTGNILAAAAEAQLSRFIHVSSLAAREPGLSDYGWSKAQSEALVTDSMIASRIIIRPPAIYGPQDSEMFEMFKMARRGLVMLPPKGRFSVIHVSDLVRLLWTLTQHSVAGVVTYEPDDGVPNGWTHQDFAKALGAAMRTPVIPLSVPGFILALAAKGDRLVRGAHAKLTPDRARYMVHPDWTVSPDKRPPATIWQPQINTPNGLAQTAIWYRENGWL